MSEAILISRIKEMKCGSKTIPQEYIDCFNDYIEKVINTRVDEEIAVNFEAGKFKTAKDLVYAYKNLEKVFTKSRQKIAELELKLAECEQEKLLNSYGMDRNADIAEDYKQQIVDLEAKLAESEKEKEYYQDLYFTSVKGQEKLKQQLAETDKLMQEYLSKCLSLEQQLAEKEKESSVLKAVIDKNKTGQFGAVHICNAISEFYEPLVKDMIIAELEKVKEFIIKNNEPTKKMTNITRFINQQINDLRGE